MAEKGDNGIGAAGVNWNTVPYFFHYWHMGVNEDTGELDMWNVTTSLDVYKRQAEELVRAIAVVSKNTVGVADHPVKAGKLRDAVIKGAISYSQGIGEAFRNAKDSGKNVSEEVANCLLYTSRCV